MKLGLKRGLFLTMFLMLLGWVGAYAQTPHRSTFVDARLDLQDTEINGNFIVISYQIPYDGVVEIRLYDEEGHKIWQNQYAHTNGKNRIVLKASKFNRGETYAYQLNYKHDEVRQNFVIPN